MVGEHDEEGAEEGESSALELIRLDDGRTTVVNARLRPLLMEWDWTTDPTTDAVIRAGTVGPPVAMFEEHVRLGARFQGIEEHPPVSRAQLRALFGGLPSYQSLLAMTTRQREHAAWEFGHLLPAASDVLGMALHLALHCYYAWRVSPTSWKFTQDVEHITPGALTQEPITARPHYPTLGQWMDAEYSGDWAKSSKSPTGLLPVTFARMLERELLNGWRGWVDYENSEHVHFRAMEAELKSAGLSVWMMTRYAMRVVRTYRPAE